VANVNQRSQGESLLAMTPELKFDDAVADYWAALESSSLTAKQIQHVKSCGISLSKFHSTKRQHLDSGTFKVLQD